MKRILFLTFFMGFCLTAAAQETSCNDGLDNDGDGFIDCFDGDCANSAACDNFYIGKDKACQTPPPATALFGMKLGARSEDRTTLSYGRMVVGDLDRDGIPEMVTTHHNDKKVYILNGSDLSIKIEINTNGFPEYFDHAIANIDDDNCAEIFIVEVIANRYYVTSYDCNGNKLWSTRAYGQPFTIGLADFDQDGNVELYYKNEILDAKTGEILIAGKGDWDDYDSGPVAVDILPDAACAECNGLELVLGGEIFAVDLTPRIPAGGSVGTAIKRFNDLPGLGGIKYFPKYVAFGYVNSMTSVADYNLDGHLDVIMNGATSKSATSTTTVFFWDVYNNQFKTFQPRQPNNSSWPHGTGRINLADVDGDGKMNATFVSGARIYSLKEDFSLLWQKTITEQTSGFTSTTVFDFNNDNAVEIVYRDEANLYIIDGKTGNAFTTVPCRSRTANDYPIVVDVDADGATEICVSCATNDGVNIGNNGNTPFGQVRTYKSSLEPWVSARKVWNQYAYFNVNVNDDLTIPRVQQQHHLVFSKDVCGTGENRALNSFLNQSAILDSKGCKTYPAADVAFVANPSLLNIIPPTCPDKDFKVSFSLKNIGDLDLNGDFPITFYNGDPRLAGAVKLGTKTIPLANFKIGDQLDIQDMLVSGSGGSFTLFAVLNDNGSTTPTPIKLPNSGFNECNFSNNIVSASVVPAAFDLYAFATDHVQCGAASAPPNGSVTAFKPEGAVGQTVGYTFYWYDGTTVGAPAAADYTGSVWTGRLNGTYSVYAIHDAYQCGSDTVQVDVALQSRTIGATVNIDKPYTSCKNPDGELSVTPDAGAIGDYTFAWFEGTVFGTSPILSGNNVLKFTRALTYSVLVTEKSSNCETLQSGTVPDLTVTPVVTTAFTAANCAPANSGEASATIDGKTGGYKFYWYQGSTTKPTEDFRGPAYTNVTAGNYTVVAEDNSTGCSSNETIVAVPAVAPVTVTAMITSQQTSCTNPNGSASASVNGTTTGYTFRWFDGNNTVNEIGTGAIIDGLEAGDYTVQATNAMTGCSDATLITIADDIKIPAVLPAVTAHQTACFPTDGAVAAIASGSPVPHVYYWFNGNIGTPDTAAANFKGMNYTGLAAGFYTVVAVDVNSRCGSAKGVVEVLDKTTVPAVLFTSTPQTSCNTLAPNGEASAQVGGTTAGYRFRWFNGADTTKFIAEAATLTNRPAGTYTVKAIDVVTGCFNTLQITISNNFVNPVVTAEVDQQLTVCNANNGQVSANVGGATAGFDFYWFNGYVSAPDTAATNFKGSVYTTRPAGPFTVVAVNKTTRCLSPESTINVLDNTIPPAIATSFVNQTSCNTLAPNGSASANIGGAMAGYEFRWFAGADTTNFIAQASGISNRAAGTYTVKAMSLTTGCLSTKQLTISSNLVKPVVSATVDQHLSVCNANNGQVSASVGGMVSGFDFYWFNGDPSATDTTLADFRRAVYGGRPVGSFSVVAVARATRCLSAKATVSVLDHTTAPVFTVIPVSQTSCNTLAPNGGASAQAGGTTAGYRFRWFDGADTTNFIVEAATLINRAAGSNTVKVIDVVTGCFNTQQVTISNNFVNPVVAAAADRHLTVCNENNGQVLANVGGATAGFDFYWFNGNPSAPDTTAANFKGSVYANRPAGPFTVVAVNKTTRCLSPKKTVTVLNNAVPPVVVANSPVDNSACSPANSNGSIMANVGGVTTNHTFHIFRGQNTNPSSEVPGSPSATLSNLSAGVYTVQAIDLVTGCKGTVEVTVGNNIVLPTLNASGTNVTDCSASNGSATANVSIGVVGDYTFTWYKGNTTKAVTDFPGETTASLTGLPAGIYSVTAFNNSLGCDVQAPVTIGVINDPTTAVTIAEVPADLIPGAICNDGTGQLGARAFSPVNTTGFLFSWYAGDRNSAMIFETNGTDVSPDHNRASGISSGRYTVIALDKDTGCQDSLAIDLPYSGEAMLVSITTAPQTNCTMADGSFRAVITPDPAAVLLGATQASYKLEVYQNGALIKSVPGVNPATVVTGLAAGSYTVLAVESDVPPLAGCASTPNDIIIDDATVHPTLLPSIVDNKNCTAASAQSGSLTLDVDGGAEVDDYKFDWRQGKSMTGMPIPAANVPFPENAALNIGGGFYTVEVTNAISGCGTVETFHVNDDPFVISVPDVDLAVAHQTDCAPLNGAAQVLDVHVDGVSAGLAGFVFEWIQGDGTTNLPSSGATELVGTPLAPGNYFVRVTESISNCQSPLKEFIILDQTSSPAISTTVITNNSNCPGSVPNGLITVEVNGGVDPLGDFTLAWFEGTGTTVALGTNFGLVAGVNSETARDLPAGTYTVQVTDKTLPGNDCAAMSTFTIVDDLPVIGIDIPDITVTNQTDCAPANGSAEVTDILVNGVATGAVAGYTFEWLQSDGATLIGGATHGPAIGVELEAGDYYVRATRVASNCISAITPFAIKDKRVVPTISLATSVNNANCSGAVPTGLLTIAVNGGEPLTDFVIEWFKGTGTTVALGTNYGLVAGLNGETAKDLPAGTYTVRVTDRTSPGNGCAVTSVFTIVDDLPVIGIDVPDITLTDLTNCAPINGSAEVTDVLVNGVATGSVAGYRFEWLRGDGTTPIDGSANGAGIGVALGAGDYYVRATRTASNCVSAVTPFTIRDKRSVPAISLAATVDNTNCSGAVPTGLLTIDVNGGESLANFAIGWFEGMGTTVALGTNSGLVAGVNGETARDLPAGTYTVRVTDKNSPGNNCESTSTFAIADDLPVIGIDNRDITVAHQTDCLPANGSAAVTEVTLDGIGTGSVSAYSFEWLVRDGVTPISGAGTGAVVAVALAPDTYYVRASNILSACVSAPVPFAIKDQTIVPVADIALIRPNTACNNNFTGELAVSVMEGTTSDIATGYAFDWFRGKHNTNPADFISSGITLSNLSQGDYTVTVRDTSTPGIGCIAIASLPVAFQKTEITSTLTSVSQVNCAPSVDGSVSVTSVSETVANISTTYSMASPMDRARFEFQWFDENMVPLSATPAPVIGLNSINSAGAGKYYVRISNALGCTAAPAGAVIVDETAPPAIELDNFRNPAVCILPETPGFMQVSADRSLNFADYTFEWFAGADDSGIIAEPNNPTLGNIRYNQAHTYTVRVTNIATHCMSRNTYRFNIDTVDIRVLASAVARTSCLVEDGGLFATTLNGTPTLYDYEWYSGPVASGTPRFTTRDVGAAPVGEYTVIATNPRHSFCVSPPYTTVVRDDRVFPDVEAAQKSPLTYCDAARANGVAIASVGNRVSGYKFDWFQGNVTGAPLYTGSEINGLVATTYVVRATDVGSGCENSASVVIDNNPVNVPEPTVVVISHHTNCVDRNGALSVSVNGNTADYLFRWYNGKGVTSRADETGELYNKLEAGLYTTTATDNQSGCVSDPVTVEILPFQKRPQFDIITVPTNCEANIGEAKFILRNDVRLYAIEWNIDGDLQFGAMLSGLPKGEFTVTATTYAQCVESKTFTILPEVLVFNGISRNNDGQNDIFEIACIQDFPDNNVKIFNRAGTLVYEANGYDNQNVFFDGISNRGINLLGTNLPDGTYFYIIDKRDGSVPRTGYLELLK